MNDTPTPTIRARIHDSAIRRVTRTFAASVGEVFSETLQNARRAGATAVAFQASGSENAVTIRRAIEHAARHYPLPVMFEDVPNTPAGGEQLDRRAFLDGALHVERWRGLVFGAFKDRWNGFGLNDPDVNFHGLTVSAQLPRVESVTGRSRRVLKIADASFEVGVETVRADSLSVDDAERLCNKLNARLGLTKEQWTALAARSMRAEAPEPGDRTAH